LVIGADGVWSVVARKSGLGQHYPHVGRCLYQELPVDGGLLDEYFTEKKQFQLYTKFMGVDGFGWVIPKKDCVNVGIGEMLPVGSSVQKKLPLSEVYRRFVSFLVEKKRIPSTFGGGKIQGGMLPFVPFEKTFADRVLLCGDAAGQVNPLTGDGIHYAMSSGKYAAEVCAMALDAGTTDASFLSRYQRLWKDDFGDEIKMFRRLMKRVLQKDERYIRLLSRDPGLITMVLMLADTQGTLSDHKWKILRRFVPLYVKDLFGF
jgi:digeranylgeranylglycerophospholipid reductase